MKSGLFPLVSTSAAAASVPSGLSLTLISTTNSCGSFAPAGTVHNCASRARKASNSVSDNCAAVPFGRAERRRVVERLAGGGEAGRLALVEQRRDLFGIEFGRRRGRLFRRRRRLGVGLFRLRLLCFLLRQRIGDRIGLAFRPAFWRLRLRPGLESGAGGGSRAALTSFFSTTLAVGSSTGLASATFSTRGFGVSVLGALLLPAVMLENSDTVIRVDRQTPRSMAPGAGSRQATTRSTAIRLRARFPIWCRPSSFPLSRNQRAEACCSISVTKATRWKPAGRYAAPSPSSPCHTRPAGRRARRCAPPAPRRASVIALSLGTSSSSGISVFCRIDSGRSP